MRERDERDFLQQRAPQRVDGTLDEIRAIVERHDLHVGRQAGLNLRDARLDGVNQRLGVHACPRDHDAADGFARALHQRRDSEGIADMHVGHLFHVHGNTASRLDRDATNVLDRSDQADAADDEPGAAGFDDIAADIQIAVAHRSHDRAERKVVAAKAVGIDVDLVLLDEPADRRHFGDTRDRVQLIADEPVLQRAQLAQGTRRAFDGVPEHMSHARSRRVPVSERRPAGAPC